MGNYTSYKFANDEARNERAEQILAMDHTRNPFAGWPEMNGVNWRLFDDGWTVEIRGIGSGEKACSLFIYIDEMLTHYGDDVPVRWKIMDLLWEGFRNRERDGYGDLKKFPDAMAVKTKLNARGLAIATGTAKGVKKPRLSPIDQFRADMTAAYMKAIATKYPDMEKAEGAAVVTGSPDIMGRIADAVSVEQARLDEQSNMLDGIELDL